MYKIFTENTADNVSLECTISAIYHLATLEIVVTDKKHVASLVLMLGSYAIGSTVLDEHGEGYWALPNIATLVPMTGYTSPTSLGSLRETIHKNGPKRRKSMDAVEQLAYSFGLKDTRIIRRGSYIEIKQSPRTPEVIRAFFIERFVLESAELDSLRNLADPESRHGLVFAPIYSNDHSYKNIYSPSHQIEETWFLGKPLHSNIKHLINNEEIKSQLLSKIIEIDFDSFSINDEGIICAIDIASYGRALEYARSNMKTFTLNSKDVEQEFRIKINELLVNFTNMIGTTQLQIAGDGLICALPKRVFKDKAVLLNDVLLAWRDVVNDLKQLNLHISDPKKQIGSRIAIHYGEYQFGRISGTINFSPAFDGENIIEAARLEQGLSQVISDNFPARKNEHYLVVKKAENFSDILKIVSQSNEWKHEGDYNLSVKEYQTGVSVFAFSE